MIREFVSECGVQGGAGFELGGEVVRTGSTREGLHTWHTHKWGVGPYLEGLFTQSNLGVVTRAGIW